MANGFSPKNIITNPDLLFGRKDLLNQLSSLANNGNSVSIIGLRRFGKTSLLRCVETLLRNNSSSKAYPLFFDFKEVGSIIKGTDNVYKYMISMFVAKLFSDGYFKEETTFRKVSIKATDSWEDIYEGLKDINSVKIQSVFEDIILFFSEYIDKTILFLFDEYEWLFRFSFDHPVGFMKLRNLSSKPNNGIIPFSFWIAGANPWDYLCTLTGSGELNVIDAPPIYISYIDNESFKLMWESELKNTENCSALLKDSIELAFQASGGIPFYGKLIGSHIRTSSIEINFSLFKSHFQELYESLQSEEKTILNELARLPRNYKITKYLLELIEKGLIIKKGSNYELKSSFFRDFIKSITVPSQNTGVFLLPESHRLADSISMLIMNVNNTHKNKKGTYIFEPVVDDAALMKDLRTPCYSLELFADFASSLYKIVFERTKETVGGNDIVLKKLPKPYKRGHIFIDIVDIMRHSLGGGHLMDTFTHKPDQLTKVKMLEKLVGSKNEPNSAEEFYKLQIATMKMFETELNKINTIVRAFT